jgi:hypothetical protein
MEAVFPPEHTRTGTGDIRELPGSGKNRNTSISRGIIMGKKSEPNGNDRK